MTTESLTRHVQAAQLNVISLKTMQCAKHVLGTIGKTTSTYVYLPDAAVKAKK